MTSWHTLHTGALMETPKKVRPNKSSTVGCRHWNVAIRNQNVAQRRHDEEKNSRRAELTAELIAALNDNRRQYCELCPSKADCLLHHLQEPAHRVSTG